MDNPTQTETGPTNKEIEDQLKQYREEQRRRHDQLSRESVVQQDLPSSTHYTRPPFVPTVPTAPSDEDLSPSHNDSSSTLYPDLGHRIESKHEQEEADAKLAKELQEQETNESATSSSLIREEPFSPTLRQPSPEPADESEHQVEEDEQFARALQESEGDQQTPTSEPAPSQQGGILSTLGSLGRGLYNAYTTYSQAHQQAQQDAEQRAEQQAIQQTTQRQIDRDEAIARRMQASEDGQEPEQEDSFTPHVASPFRFTYGRPTNSYLAPFNYTYRGDDMEDVVDEDELLTPPFAQFPHAQQWVQLSALNSLLRSTGAPPSEPVFQHLRELMQSTRNHDTAALPRQRYQFPSRVLRAQGVENLPPELLNMMNGETDTSYESLLDLAERMQPVSRGANTQQIDQLPSRTYSEGSMPADQRNCGICLSEYEAGEQLTSLPCLHSFHKECITHWLGINKICPVCRAEITQSE